MLNTQKDVLIQTINESFIQGLGIGYGGEILGGIQNLGAGNATLLASFLPTQEQLPLAI